MPAPRPKPTPRPRTDAPLRLVGGHRDAQLTVAELVEQAQLAERRGQPTEARALYERALAGLHRPEDGAHASALLRWIARCHLDEGESDLASEVVEVARFVAEARGDRAAVGQAMNVRASIAFKQGALDEAETLWREVREVAGGVGEVRLAAMAAQNLGVVANIRGDLPEALARYEACLADYRSLGLAREVGMVLNNLGRLYADEQRYTEAARAYDEALQVSTLLGDLGASLLLETNVAELCVARGALDEARDSCGRMRDIAARLQDGHARGEVERVHGVVARALGEYARAEEHFDRAETLAESRRDVLLAAETAREKSELYRLQGRNRDMLQSLNRTHRLFSQLRAERELADVSRRTARLETQFLDVVRRWGSSIEAKDRHTQGHCERVADLACRLAERVGLDERSLFWFRIGALLHDVGKLIVPADVLNKPGALTADEWELVRRHPVAGVEMLADIDFPWDVRPIVESHHERWDGRGYPHGLAGEAIPLTARILCVADVYDALTSARSYKPALAHDAAMRILREEAGRQFDPTLVALFDAMLGDSAPEPVRTTPAGAMAVQAADELAETAGPRDDLTGLPMRRAIADAATATLRRELALGRTVGLLVLDVDHFKLVNDTYGHLQGDDVLRAVVAALRSALEPTQLLGRYAGDEFVVLAPALDAAATHALGERLRAAVERLQVALREAPGSWMRVSVTIGGAAAPTHGDAYDTLFDAADRALYVAKRQGRNAVAVAGEEDATPGTPRLQIERFVGRVSERRSLARLAEASSDGRPAIVAVSGEAGVGKSTLVRQLAPEVRLRGGTLVVGRAAEADLKPPYGPWAEIIASLHRQDIVPARTWHELPLLVPSLGGAGGAPAAPRGRYALLDEIVEYLRLAAQRTPLVLVLDDFHWADAASWDTLEHLSGQLEQDRILVCLTIRAEEAGSEVIARRRSLSRDERFHEIVLRRLAEQDLGDWLGAIFRRNDTSESLLPFLFRQSEGNPLLVVQLLRALLEDDAIVFADGRWQFRAVDHVALPVAITDLVARRLERVSPEARRILATAAAIGRTFDVDLLLAASTNDEDAVLDAIDEGLAASVLEHGPGRDGEHYSFAHGLLVQAIRESGNVRRMRRVHARIAAALEARPGAPAADIALHFERAGEPARAFEYALRAGDQAATLYALGEAESFFAMAERLADGARALADARLKRARVLEAAGRYADAVALYEVVLSGDGIDDPASLAELRRACVRVHALCGEHPARTLACLRELLEGAETAGVAAERVALTTMISLAHGRLGEREAAEAHARHAVELAASLGDRKMLADALVRVGTTLLDHAPREAIETYRVAFEHFAALDERHGQVRCHINSGIAHSRVGDPDAAARSYLAGYTMGVDAHAPDLAGLAALNLGVLHLVAGRYEQARERFTESLRLFVTCRSEPHRLATLYNLAHLAREAGETKAAAEHYQDAVELARQLGQVDVEVGAISGLGLVGRQLGRRPVALGAQQEAARLLAGRADWWFQGRELAEALDILLLADQGAGDEAATRLASAAAAASRHDRYAAAWLVAECVGALRSVAAPAATALANEYLRVARALDAEPLSTRLAAAATV